MDGILKNDNSLLKVLVLLKFKVVLASDSVYKILV